MTPCATCIVPISLLCDRPGRTWSRHEYTRVCAWVLDDLGRVLFALCLKRWGRDPEMRRIIKQTFPDILADFIARRLERVTAGYDRSLGCCLASWIGFCFLRFAWRRIKVLLREQARSVSLDAPMRRDGDGHEPWTVASVLSDPAPDPLERLMEMELQERIAAAIARLPQDKALLIKLWMDQTPYEGIVRTLGGKKTQGNLRTNVHRILKQLRPILVEEGVMT